MTPIVIIQGGQTGVDRGAWRAVKTFAHPDVTVTGAMPRGRNDEHGAIPSEVQDNMVQHHVPGFAARTVQNVMNSDAVLVVVRDANHPYVSPGTRMTLNEAKKRNVVRRVLDNARPSTITAFAECIGCVEPFRVSSRIRPLKLMVAGPRKSRWPDGEQMAFDIVTALLQRIYTGAPQCVVKEGTLPTMRVIRDEEITIEHAPDWTGSVFIRAAGRILAVPASQLVTGKWPVPHVLSREQATRVTAMATAAYVVWSLRAVLGTE